MASISIIFHDNWLGHPVFESNTKKPVGTDRRKVRQIVAEIPKPTGEVVNIAITVTFRKQLLCDVV